MNTLNANSNSGQWLDEVGRAYASAQGQVFLLHGNVGDVFPCEERGGAYVSLRTVLAERLSQSRSVVLFWDKSAGFAFADEILGTPTEDRQPTMRQKFLALVGLTEKKKAPASGASSQLLAQLAGQMGGAEAAEELPCCPKKAFPLMEKALMQGTPGDRKIAVVVEYAESVLPHGDFQSEVAVTLQRWAGIDSPLTVSRNPVFLIERNPERVAELCRHDDSNVVPVKINRPQRPDIAAFLAWTQVRYSEVAYEPGLDAAQLANLATGLRCKDVEDILMQALVDQSPLTRDYVWHAKAKLISQQCQGTLRVVRPKHGFDAIGGLDHVVSALRVQVGKLRTGDRTTDKGWLLMGPPGTGKTILGEALAAESGVNFVMLGNVQSKYVGESERNMTLALEIAQAMAPTIVFIDEAAEAIGNGEGHSGDSGVSDRVRGMLQNVMGDDANRGKLFFMLATNYPDRMAAAMLRDGRMDKRIPLLPPEAEGRSAITAVMCRKYGIDTAELDLSIVVDATEGWTGAELEALILRAKSFAEEVPGGEVTNTHLAEALDDYIPSRDNEAFAAMTRAAIKYTNSRRLLPAKYREAYDAVRSSVDIDTETLVSPPKPVAAEGRPVGMTL